MNKILYIFPSLNIGGAEIAAINIANYLQVNKNFDVSIFVMDDSESLLPLIEKTIKIIKLNLSFRKSFFFRAFYKYLLVPIKLREILAFNSYKYVLAIYEHDAEVPVIISKILFPAINKKTNTIFISIIQNSLDGKNHFFNFRRRIINRTINSFRKYYFDHMIVVSQAIRTELLKKNIRNATIINNPINTDMIDNSMKVEIENSIVNLISDQYVIAVSRIAIQKDLLFLLRAFCAIQCETKNNLVIIGSVSEKESLKQMKLFIKKNKLEKRIFYLGSVINPYPLISKAQLLVNTSLYEGNPLSFLEALYLEVPVITRNFIGLKELEICKHIIIESSNDPKAYGKTILSALENRKKKDISVKNEIKDKYQIKVIAEEYLKCVNSL